MENEKPKTIILSASANTGIGLWTMICVFFCKIFGRESVNYWVKVNRVKNSVENRLCKVMEKHPEYVFSDYRIVKEGNLSFVGTVIGTLKTK